MLSFALNHMTVPSLSMEQLCDLGRALDVDGIELRNDLDRPLFDGQVEAAAAIEDLTIFALAEVKAFNAFDEQTYDRALALMDLAVAAGAQAIALIPQVGGDVPADGLKRAISELGPELKSRGLFGLIEPIGFENSTLRDKSTVVSAMDASPFGDEFGLIHDTFHHFLADGAAIYPAYTKLVHISGVTSAVSNTDMQDAHRVLVDGDDRLGNVSQISDLMRGGYNGPYSFEVFSPDVHALTDPKDDLSRSIRFIEDKVMALAA